ncbi:MAG TPA: hypothetical protein VFA69_04970, partial [Candidatus Nitrosotalea sp.]|nr:hypothetical protein [Candidatus Nitrosotalea sp.]
MTTELQDAIYSSIGKKKSQQRISQKGLIVVSKKAWATRAGVVSFGFFLILINIQIGLRLDD